MKIFHINFTLLNCLSPNAVAHYQYPLTRCKFIVSSHSCAQFEALPRGSPRTQTGRPSLLTLLSRTRSPSLRHSGGTLSTKKRVWEIRRAAPPSVTGPLFSHFQDFASGQLLLGTDFLENKPVGHSPFLFANISLCVEYLLDRFFFPHTEEEVAGKEEEGAPHASCQAVGGTVAFPPRTYVRSLIQGALDSWALTLQHPQSFRASWPGSTKRNRAGVAKSLLI